MSSVNSQKPETRGEFRVFVHRFPSFPPGYFVSVSSLSAFLILLRVGLEEGCGQIGEANGGCRTSEKVILGGNEYLQVLREILSEERFSPTAMREKLNYRCTLHNLSPRNVLPSAGWRGSSRIFRRDEATSIENSGIVTCVYSLFLVCRVNNTTREPSIKRSAIKT